jgi:hypothetical protein
VIGLTAALRRWRCELSSQEETIMNSDQNRRRAHSAWPSGCRELRILDGDVAWRIVYEVEGDALVILDAEPRSAAALDDSIAGAAC